MRINNPTKTKPGVNSGTPEGIPVTVPLVASVMPLLWTSGGNFIQSVGLKPQYQNTPVRNIWDYKYYTMLTTTHHTTKCNKPQLSWLNINASFDRISFIPLYAFYNKLICVP